MYPLPRLTADSPLEPDEIIITSNMHDHAKRPHSFELVAAMMNTGTQAQETAAG